MLFLVSDEDMLAVRQLLSFLYTGDLVMTPNSAASVLSLATKLQINSAITKAQQYINNLQSYSQALHKAVTFQALSQSIQVKMGEPNTQPVYLEQPPDNDAASLYAQTDIKTSSVNVERDGTKTTVISNDSGSDISQLEPNSTLNLEQGNLKLDDLKDDISPPDTPRSADHLAEENDVITPAPEFDGPVFKCPKCDFYGRRLRDLPIHIAKHGISCPNCDIIMRGYGQLTTHVNNHHNSAWNCKHCKMKLKSLRDLYGHYAKGHFICRLCSLKCSNYVDLCRHQHREHVISGKTYKSSAMSKSEEQPNYSNTDKQDPSTDIIEHSNDNSQNHSPDKYDKGDNSFQHDELGLTMETSFTDDESMLDSGDESLSYSGDGEQGHAEKMMEGAAQRDATGFLSPQSNNENITGEEMCEPRDKQAVGHTIHNSASAEGLTSVNIPNSDFCSMYDFTAGGHTRRLYRKNYNNPPSIGQWDKTVNRLLYQCPKCDYSSYRLHNLPIHVAKHGAQCPNCSLYADGIAMLTKHVQTLHNNKWKCSFCGTTLHSYNSLVGHYSRHHFMCRLCFTQCENRPMLFQHHKKHLVGYKDSYQLSMMSDDRNDKKEVIFHDNKHSKPFISDSADNVTYSINAESKSSDHTQTTQTRPVNNNLLPIKSMASDLAWNTPDLYETIGDPNERGMETTFSGNIQSKPLMNQLKKSKTLSPTSASSRAGCSESQSSDPIHNKPLKIQLKLSNNESAESMWNIKNTDKEMSEKFVSKSTSRNETPTSSDLIENKPLKSQLKSPKKVSSGIVSNSVISPSGIVSNSVIAPEPLSMYSDNNMQVDNAPSSSLLPGSTDDPNTDYDLHTANNGTSFLSEHVKELSRYFQGEETSVNTESLSLVPNMLDLSQRTTDDICGVGQAVFPTLSYTDQRYSGLQGETSRPTDYGGMADTEREPGLVAEHFPADELFIQQLYKEHAMNTGAESFSKKSEGRMNKRKDLNRKDNHRSKTEKIPEDIGLNIDSLGSKQRLVYQCHECDYSSDRFRDLPIHMAKHGVACSHCCMPLEGYVSLSKHMKNFHNNEWKCLYCNVVLRSFRCLSGHYAKVHYMCRQCLKKCSGPSSLEAHHKTHMVCEPTLSAGISAEGEISNEMDDSPEASTHPFYMMWQVEDDKPVAENRRDKSAGGQNDTVSLNDGGLQDMKSDAINSLQDESEQTEDSDESNENPDEMNTISELPDAYQCPKCKMTSSRLRDLPVHIAKHGICCPNCSMPHVALKSLKKHIRINHAGWNCGLCSVVLSSFRRLTGHYAHTHHMCRICFKKCDEQRSLSDHLKIHSARP